MKRLKWRIQKTRSATTPGTGQAQIVRSDRHAQAPARPGADPGALFSSWLVTAGPYCWLQRLPVAVCPSLGCVILPILGRRPSHHWPRRGCLRPTGTSSPPSFARPLPAPGQRPWPRLPNGSRMESSVHRRKATPPSVAREDGCLLLLLESPPGNRSRDTLPARELAVSPGGIHIPHSRLPLRSPAPRPACPPNLGTALRGPGLGSRWRRGDGVLAWGRGQPLAGPSFSPISSSSVHPRGRGRQKPVKCVTWSPSWVAMERTQPQCRESKGGCWNVWSV